MASGETMHIDHNDCNDSTLGRFREFYRNIDIRERLFLRISNNLSTNFIKIRS